MEMSSICGSSLKPAMVERGGWGKNPKSVWWNDEVKATLRRKEADWKEVLAASDEEAKERCMKAYRKVKRCIYQSKRK